MEQRKVDSIRINLVSRRKGAMELLHTKVYLEKKTLTYFTAF
jgi:hypothetical protein